MNRRTLLQALVAGPIALRLGGLAGASSITADVSLIGSGEGFVRDQSYVRCDLSSGARALARCPNRFLEFEFLAGTLHRELSRIGADVERDEIARAIREAIA